MSEPPTLFEAEADDYESDPAAWLARHASHRGSDRPCKVCAYLARAHA